MQDLPSIELLKTGSMVLIDKPYLWSSFQAINKLKYKYKIKIGHCGTLDPLATGLLICCTGSFTKKISQFQQLPKVYTGIIQLGATTPTYDLESKPENFKPFESYTHQELQAATLPFIGEIFQTPPIHSAIKKDGKRAYELARAGEAIVLQPRKVTITQFDIVFLGNGAIGFTVECGSGTYIRSLAHDYGQLLGCGAYLQKLRRTKIGSYSVDDAFEVELI